MNVIPVIAKADTISKNELLKFKVNIFLYFMYLTILVANIAAL